ncbi:SphA family protein [Pedobacter heparinus]|uniref:Protein involved in meta-pathway of phenol degradation n=1 Tax=Pedobacter heparinus (strain ATCC 13125 / DSM 2366 / CIP 104194 / JCM 7457 / NBRC 12017 / NCIMB 9290 / NRRL B-14731 / HIM 762-3) TaxID=485917 RepID=C6XX10_PEDHD|nr:transporter [Pedobacter heparinus]ACU04304.1 Protein involved in meta-pathway of phenol degradation [Pedobacter heparinus DSM 2366]
MKRFLTLFAAVLCYLSVFSQGHYTGSSFNPGDYFAPHPGWIIPVWYGYANMDYRNASGNKSDVLINPAPGNPTSLHIKQNVVTNSFILMAIYGGKGKILGANWGMMAIPMLNSPTANIALDYYSSQTGSGNYVFTNKSLGFGDMYVQPVWLSWTKGKFIYAVNYGFWAPTGRYKPHDLDNGGHGYWSHNIRVAGSVKTDPKVSVTLAATMELNSWQHDTDFKEGSHLTFDLGSSYLLNKRGDMVGLFSHYTTQVSDDKGTNGGFVSDRIAGLGGFVSYWITPMKIGVMGRLTQNFAGKNRFAGTAVQAGVNILIPNGSH